MALDAAHIVIGLVLLYLGADALVRGSSRLALRGGLKPLTVGLTVVAFGTSTPELFVSIEAAFMGREAIAVGNIVGSNIANLALILGLAALIRPMLIQSELCRIDLPIMASSAAVMSLLLVDGGLNRVEGALLALGLVGYVVLNLRSARGEHEEVRRGLVAALPKKPSGLMRDLTLVVFGLVMLMGGGDALIEGAAGAATDLGVSDAVIGLTLVAVATSLPELATSAIAAFRGEGDIALGNVIGSNVFNVLGVLGPAALVRPMHTAGVTVLDLGVMVLISFLVLPLMRTGFKLTRGEGALLLGIYGGYLYLLLL